MRSPISGVITRSIASLHRAPPLSTATRHLCATASTDTRTKKLERIADDLLKLNRIELYDYSILFSHKLGLNRYGSAVPISAGADGDAKASGSAETKTAEKTAFDVKLEKFEAASKIKVIKEIRTFTELGLKEAKELVEKAPCVVKKGVTIEEANQIIEKLKALGAVVALE